MIERDLVVLAVHGEGDRVTVNKLQEHRNRLSAIKDAADEPPDVIVVLRDPDQGFRIEWPVETWEEVEEWKKMVGFDKSTRHWKLGATIKVRFGA